MIFFKNSIQILRSTIPVTKSSRQWCIQLLYKLKLCTCSNPYLNRIKYVNKYEDSSYIFYAYWNIITIVVLCFIKNKCIINHVLLYFYLKIIGNFSLYIINTFIWSLIMISFIMYRVMWLWRAMNNNNSRLQRIAYNFIVLK